MPPGVRQRLLHRAIDSECDRGGKGKVRVEVCLDGATAARRLDQGAEIVETWLWLGRVVTDSAEQPDNPTQLGHCLLAGLSDGVHRTVRRVV